MVLYATFMIPSTQQHFTLRIILCWNGYIPWNYARFLNYATERMFLQRIGGRYRFIHKLLQEHFAQLQPTPEWGTISSKAITDEDWDEPW